MMFAENYVLFVHWMMLIHCICVLEVSILPLSTIFLMYSVTVLTMWYQLHPFYLTHCMLTIHSSNVYINNMMSYTYMWQTIVTKISVFGTKTMISDRKTMYSAKYKASRVNDMVFHAEIEIFDRNVLQASYKNAKCLVSGTETGFFFT